MRTVEVIKELRSNIKEFCYGMYGDNMREEDILNSELKGLGILNGDDEMIWKSPDKSLYFEVSRDYSSSKTGSDEGYRYVCTLSIKNNLGVPISKIMFTEIDAIRILSGFVDFATPSYYSPNTICIDINPNNTYLEKHIIELQSIKLENMDCVLFRINKQIPYNQYIANIVTIQMTHEQLNDLAFHIFFAILIDIEVPVEFDEEMFRIEDYINTENYYTFHKRRMELEKLVQQTPEKSYYAQSYINDNTYLLNEKYGAPMNTPVLPDSLVVDKKPITSKNYVNRNITMIRK